MERDGGKEEGGSGRENVQKGRETAKRVETMEVKTERNRGRLERPS